MTTTEGGVGQFDLTGDEAVWQYATWERQITLQDADNPPNAFDLTGWQNLKAKIVSADGSATATATVTIDNAAAGQITVLFPGSQLSASGLVGRNGVFQLFGELAATSNYYLLLTGRVHVRAGAFDPEV